MHVVSSGQNEELKDKLPVSEVINLRSDPGVTTFLMFPYPRTSLPSLYNYGTWVKTTSGVGVRTPLYNLGNKNTSRVPHVFQGKTRTLASYLPSAVILTYKSNDWLDHTERKEHIALKCKHHTAGLFKVHLLSTLTKK